MRLHSMLNRCTALTGRLQPGLDALLFEIVTTDPCRALVSWLLAQPIAQRRGQLSARGALERACMLLSRGPTRPSRDRQDHLS